MYSRRLRAILSLPKDDLLFSMAKIRETLYILVFK
jgi:hypothetical protein